MQLLDQAIQHHQAGRLAEAEQLYHQVLRDQPSHPEALNLLGYLHRQQSRFDLAIEMIGKAIAASPRDARFPFNLGETCRAAQRFQQAADAYRMCTELDPRFAPAWHGLGISLESHGLRSEALDAYGKALEADPKLVPAYESLGRLLYELGRIDAALEVCKAGVGMAPNSASLHATLGATFAEQRDFTAALAEYARAAELRPNWAPPRLGAANVLQATARFGEAEAAARQALALDPNFPGAWNALGLALDHQGRLTEAQQAYERAIALAPRDARPRGNLGVLRLNRLDQAGAVSLLREAVELSPISASLHSTFVSSLNYGDDIPEESIFEEHRRWSASHASALQSDAIHARHDRADHPLRIGYVSPDLMEHPVAHFMEAVLAGHDRARCRPIVYSDTVTPDQVTARLQRLIEPADWNDVRSFDDSRLAELIRSHRIDVLIDLASHTANNRLLVFARKPAPVQITWLGYPNTTGLPATTMNYRLTDAWSDPAGAGDVLYSEQLWRLPRTFLCYTPSPAAPQVSPLPMRISGDVTFGSFNNMSKVTRRMLSLWAQILQRVAGSRLVLKNKATGDPGVRDLLLGEFAALGVEPSRIMLRRPEPSHLAHLGLYDQIDIALDTFPYHGTTTTCDSLWMGVPVVTLAGDSHRSRVGVSLLNNIGLPELIAIAPKRYVQIAAALAEDLPRLEALRATLRERMKDSPVMDATAFVRDLEAALQKVARAETSGVRQKTI